MSNPERVIIDPNIMLGKPTIRGTRVTVELLRRKLSEGLTLEELLEAYPSITRDDLLAPTTLHWTPLALLPPFGRGAEQLGLPPGAGSIAGRLLAEVAAEQAEFAGYGLEDVHLQRFAKRQQESRPAEVADLAHAWLPS